MGGLRLYHGSGCPLGGIVPICPRVTPPLCPQSSMNLPPDKARLLRQYDNEKKWDLICDQVGTGWSLGVLVGEGGGLCCSPGVINTLLSPPRSGSR